MRTSPKVTTVATATTQSNPAHGYKRDQGHSASHPHTLDGWYPTGPTAETSVGTSGQTDGQTGSDDAAPSREIRMVWASPSGGEPVPSPSSS